MDGIIVQFLFLSNNNTSMQTSPQLTSLNFFNKPPTTPSSTSILITSPNSLDNYFRCQQARIKGSHLPMSSSLSLSIPMHTQFNSIVSSQSLKGIVGKRLRGVRLGIEEMAVLRAEVGMVDCRTGDAVGVRVQSLLGYYLEYRKNEVVKALYSDKLRQTIIKPFLRIHSAITHKLYKIDPREDKLARSLHRLFDQILKQNRLSTCVGDMDDIERMYDEAKGKGKGKGRVLREAEQVLKDVEMGMARDKEERSGDEDKFKIRDLRNCPKPQSRKTKKQLPQPSKTPGQPKQKSCTRIKFKGLDTEQNQDDLDDDETENLCYELGLLISDTDRILRPVEQDGEGLRIGNEVGEG